ncbi:hypothetical protein [Haloferula sp.]|uniref:hypothetical protein n=1 Tax=Haloferula sp. TaxID=2497595 RepID=UPI003C778E2F
MIFRFALKTLFVLPSLAGGAVMLNQVETFDNPTDWTSGSRNPTPPIIRPSTGPNGSGDSALQISSSVGNGPGSRLISFNQGDWSGNYSGQGITGLSMDLRNTGASNLFVRIAVNGPGGWFVTDGQAVNSGLGYATFLFGIEPAQLNPAATRVTLGDDAGATLADVSEIRILHSFANSSALGEVANASLRVDNITAVPEPGVGLLAGLSLLFLRFRKR